MTAAILLVLGLIAAVPAHWRLSGDAHPATAAAAPPVIYQFKVAIEGQLTYDNPFLEIYPKVGSGYGCIPVTRATTTLSFMVRASTRPGPDLIYGVGTSRFGLLGGMTVVSSSARIRATNEFGQPGGRTECVPQPPDDCGDSSRPARGLLVRAHISRVGFGIGLDGTRFQAGTPSRSCHTKETTS
jgi:hypothetical protein